MTAPGARTAHLTPVEVDDLLDDALGGPERAAAEAHVAACAPCAGALDDARALLAASRALSRGVAAPPELWARVAAATVYERAVRRRVLRTLRAPLLAAAVALVVGTAVVTAAFVARHRSGRGVAAPAAPPAPVAPIAPRPPAPPVPPPAPAP